MQISRNSWHYRYLQWMDKQPHRAKTHCEYWAKLLTTPLFATLKWAVLLALTCAAISLMLAILWTLVGVPVMYLLDLNIFGYSVERDQGEFSLAAWGAVALIAAILLFIVYVPSWMENTTRLCMTAYRDWRDKTCTRIDFKD